MIIQELTVRFNSIHVLESLGASDRKTGTELFENILRRPPPSLAGLKSYLHTISGRDDLFYMLDKIFGAVLQQQSYPCIHLEMHGNAAGLGLNNGETIAWDELGEILRKINVVTKNNLFISIAACYGAYAFSCMNFDPWEQSPFFAFLGPPTEIGERDIGCAFETFYSHLFQTFEIRRSFDALNATLPRTPFIMISSEEIFEKIKTTYLQQMREPSNEDRWATQLAVILKSRRTYHDTPFEILVELAHSIAPMKETLIDKMKDHFLIR